VRRFALAKVSALADERGKREQKQKSENSVRNFQNTEMTHKKSCPRLSGKVSALADERGKREQKGKKEFFTKRYYLSAHHS